MSGNAAKLQKSLDSAPPGSERSEEEWIVEIERRVQSVLDGEPGIPWEDVKAAVSQRLGRG